MIKVQETAPEEIFLIVGPTDDTDFKELSDVTWADKPVYEETAIKYVKHPKLGIPKKIAEMLDGVSIEAKNYVKANHFDSYSVLDDFTELREFYEADEDEIFPGFMGLKEYINNNLSICVAYLAGKALGVELVSIEG